MKQFLLCVLLVISTISFSQKGKLHPSLDVYFAPVFVNLNEGIQSNKQNFCYELGANIKGKFIRKSTSSDFRVGVNLNNRSFNILSGASSNLTLVGKSSFTYLSFPFSHGFSFDYFNFWKPSLNLGGMLGFIVNDNRKRYNSNGSITDIDELAETMYHYELDQFELFPIYFQFSLTNVFPINEKVSILLEPNFLVPLRTKHYSDDGSSNFVFTLKLGMNYKLY
jgi:hypothetical protein